MSWDVRNNGLEDPDACVHCGGPCDHPTRPNTIGGYAVAFAAALLFWFVFWVLVFGAGEWLARR